MKKYIKALAVFAILSLFICSQNCFGSSSGSVKIKDKPNIIYILADDLGYGDISCINDDSKIQTPNIDKLASEGVIFSDAHTSSSVCTPSRYGIMTGRYSFRTWMKSGVLGGYSHPLIEKERPTVASLLKSQGYCTECIGKWHLGLGWYKKDGQKLENERDLKCTDKPVDYSHELWDAPVDHGFDYFYGIAASLDIPPYTIIENRKSEIPTDFWSKAKYHYSTREGYAMKGRKPEEYLPLFADKVIKSITANGKKGKPYFIYFPMPAPHNPIVPLKKYQGRSDAGSYGDYVIEIDDIIGKIQKTLKKTGQEKNTLIIFTSDNGPEIYAYKRAIEYDHRSSGNLRGVKRDTWEGGHRVPFIVKYPQVVKAGTKEEKTICLSDFYATLQEIFHIPHNIQQEGGEDSFSIWPLLTGNGEFTRNFTIHQSCSGDLAIRKGSWVYIDAQSGNSNNQSKDWINYYTKYGYPTEISDKYELFNLDKDEEEYHNVYAQHPEIVKELKAILDESVANGRTH